MGNTNKELAQKEVKLSYDFMHIPNKTANATNKEINKVIADYKQDMQI